MLYFVIMATCLLRIHDMYQIFPLSSIKDPMKAPVFCLILEMQQFPWEMKGNK